MAEPKNIKEALGRMQKAAMHKLNPLAVKTRFCLNDTVIHSDEQSVRYTELR